MAEGPYSTYLNRNNSEADCSISLKVGTVLTHTLQTFNDSFFLIFRSAISYVENSASPNNPRNIPHDRSTHTLSHTFFSVEIYPLLRKIPLNILQTVHSVGLLSPECLPIVLLEAVNVVQPCSVSLAILYVLTAVCDGGRVWQDCASACHPTCSQPVITECIAMCDIGCFCPEDRPIWYNNSTCITVDECPGLYTGSCTAIPSEFCLSHVHA